MIRTLLLIKGVALGLWGQAEPHHVAMLREIAALGADHVSLVVAWRQPDVRANALAPGGFSDDGLRAVIRAAHREKLRVLLFPIVDVARRADKEWRGTLAPADVGAWWQSYEAFILHYAAIAAEERVELFSVGSELCSTESWRDRWYHLISKVERVYAGPLVYSANWDHYEAVSFWERVTYLGVTGYFELAREARAPEAALAATWQAARRRLTAFAAKVGKPLLLTEVGYPSQEGSATRPWDYTTRAPVDLEEQRRAYAAFASTWRGDAGLAGVVFWDWQLPGGAEDGSYTPRGKPAEQILRRFFAAP